MFSVRKVTAVDCEEGGCFAVLCDEVFVVEKGVTLLLVVRSVCCEEGGDFAVGC